MSYDCIEHVVININMKNQNKSLTLCSLYRAPNTNEHKFVEEYECLLKELYKMTASKKSILGMDHNLDYWKHSKRKQTHDFIELNLDNNLIPSITRPTRITKNSATLIDNIILSQSLLVQYESRIILDDISDHLPSLVKLEDVSEKKNIKKIITSQNIGKWNLEKINNSLLKQNWSSVITENVDESFNNVYDLVQNTIELHAPKVSRNLGI